jgi:hypothetical protein
LDPVPLASLETYLLQLYLVSPSIPQSYSSCQFLAAKLGRNLWGSSLNSCYQPESIPRISPSLAMKLTAIVTLLVGANALELTKV